MTKIYELALDHAQFGIAVLNETPFRFECWACNSSWSGSNSRSCLCPNGCNRGLAARRSYYQSANPLHFLRKKVKVGARKSASIGVEQPGTVFFDNRREVSHEPEWLTTEEAARYLRISVGSLRNKTSYGAIPYGKLGRSNRYRLDDLRNLLLKSKENSHGL